MQRNVIATWTTLLLFQGENLAHAASREGGKGGFGLEGREAPEVREEG